jgi:putative spermidine/putrescine transport system substrate-binding protein
MTKRAIFLSIGVALLVIAAAGWWLTRPLPTLTVTTWPGAYGRAQAVALLHPYGEANRINVRIAQYDGGLDHIRAEVAARRYDWDVIDFELEDAVKGCNSGLLARIDGASLPQGADGSPASHDFVANAIGPCWVGSVVFSQVIGYREGPETLRPSTLADFFDVARFPGPRALRRKSAKFNLELALLADGVKPSMVYPLLSTAEGLERAFAKLQSIRTSIVWWDRSSEPIQMLTDGRARFATALNGDVFDAAAVHHAPIGVIWDRQLYELDVFAVPEGDPKRDRAFDFIRFATGSEPLAQVANWVPYGPARRSAFKFVGRNPDLGIPMLNYLPTAPQNFTTAFPIDDSWWCKHAAAIAPKWRAWLGADAPVPRSDANACA